MLVARAAGRAFGSALFASFLVCVRPAGPRARRQVLHFRGARNLCWSPGRPGALSFLCFFFRFSFVCVARARGLDAKFFIFTTLVIYVGRPGGWARFRFCAFCFVSRLCASRGPAGSTPSFRIRGARNLCCAPGRPGWLSIRFVSVRFSCVLARRPRGLGPEFSIFPPRVASVGPAGRAGRLWGAGRP